MEERTIRTHLARRGFAHAPITCRRAHYAPVWMVLIWSRSGQGVAYLRGTLAEVLCGIARLPAA